MYKSLSLSIIFHLLIIGFTILTLPFAMKQPIDVPPMISIDLIQISEKTALPFAPKAKEIIEKIKEEKERIVKKQAPPKKQINHTKHPRIGLSKATDRLWRFKITT